MELLKSRTGRVLIESHRGAEGLAPENSWSALNLGAESEADFLEIDVQLSRDGIAFLRHNYSLPDGRACWRVPWSEIKDLKVEKESIPLLEDVLVWARDSGVCLSLDLKVGFLPERKLAQEVIRLLRRTQTEDRAMLISWDHQELLHIKVNYPRMVTRALLRGRLTNYSSFLGYTQVDAISLAYGMVRPGDVDEIHRAGVAVALGEMWQSDFQAVETLDVDIVSWGDPNEAKSLLDQM